ncbi:transmembrane protein, putative (macronuclear) [Tetrahymena thermophila SB210]|uniref:Transmembrane protein, putative n=1 Tax=Tetrahymena thermophila (strain SB210) TaxID=312017 RepID=W7XBC1_TETTS|nr:transmembrane protein, putative [Tetrahymena thermophila SB210]EWS70976.1 transmembrane protein, putative [Tetrahymena thermophila SB210]|eukprot:XP_012656491.1 transmembrane protein, putative [Tetrahymena thermophila SB210]
MVNQIIYLNSFRYQMRKILSHFIYQKVILLIKRYNSEHCIKLHKIFYYKYNKNNVIFNQFTFIQYLQQNQFYYVIYSLYFLAQFSILHSSFLDFLIKKLHFQYYLISKQLNKSNQNQKQIFQLKYCLQTPHFSHQNYIMKIINQIYQFVLTNLLNHFLLQIQFQNQKKILNNSNVIFNLLAIIEKAINIFRKSLCKINGLVNISKSTINLAKKYPKKFNRIFKQMAKSNLGMPTTVPYIYSQGLRKRDMLRFILLYQNVELFIPFAIRLDVC